MLSSSQEQPPRSGPTVKKIFFIPELSGFKA